MLVYFSVEKEIGLFILQKKVNTFILILIQNHFSGLVLLNIKKTNLQIFLQPKIGQIVPKQSFQIISYSHHGDLIMIKKTVQLIGIIVVQESHNGKVRSHNRYLYIYLFFSLS